jgi:uncharacterized protein YciI
MLGAAEAGEPRHPPGHPPELRTEQLQPVYQQFGLTRGRRDGVVPDKLLVMYFLLLYDLVDDYMERRPAFRQEHLVLARKANERGELVLAGAYADPPDGAALVFQADSESVVRDFVAHDPYVREGLVERWAIRRWTVVIGGQ